MFIGVNIFINKKSLFIILLERTNIGTIGYYFRYGRWPKIVFFVIYYYFKFLSGAIMCVGFTIICDFVLFCMYTLFWVEEMLGSFISWEIFSSKFNVIGTFSKLFLIDMLQLQKREKLSNYD